MKNIIPIKAERRRPGMNTNHWRALGKRRLDTELSYRSWKHINKSLYRRIKREIFNAMLGLYRDFIERALRETL